MYLYVVEFESGVVKVGRSAAPSQRIASVKCSKEAGRSKAKSIYVSKPFPKSLPAEHCALLYLRAGEYEGHEPFSGREWFNTVSFDEAKKMCEAAIRVTKKAKKSGVYFGHYKPNGRLHAFVAKFPHLFMPQRDNKQGANHDHHAQC